MSRRLRSGWERGLAVGVVLMLPLVSCGGSDPPVPGGGAETLIDLIERLEVMEEPPRQGYSRELFEHWVVVDASGCTVRHKVLRAQATAVAPLGSPSGGGLPCVVFEGDWELLFDGSRHVGLASEIDVDHVVALAEAWDSGAWDWTPLRRQTFANDPLNLIVADRQVNKDKADLDAAEWSPSDRRAHCITAAKIALTKLRYELSVDAAERRSLIAMAGSCDRSDQRSIGGFPLPGTPGFDLLTEQILAEQIRRETIPREPISTR
jgi:hypothetical protein